MEPDKLLELRCSDVLYLLVHLDLQHVKTEIHCHYLRWIFLYLFVHPDLQHVENEIHGHYL